MKTKSKIALRNKKRRSVRKTKKHTGGSSRASSGSSSEKVNEAKRKELGIPKISTGEEMPDFADYGRTLDEQGKELWPTPYHKKAHNQDVRAFENAHPYNPNYNSNAGNNNISVNSQNSTMITTTHNIVNGQVIGTQVVHPTTLPPQMKRVRRAKNGQRRK